MAPVTLVSLIFILRRLQPVTVVTSLYQADVVGMLAASLVRVCQRIVIQHDVQQFGWLGRWGKRRWSLPLATQVVAVSQTVADFLHIYFAVPQQKTWVIPNGVDTLRWSVGIRRLEPQQLPVVGMVGRLEPIKGAKYFLEALNILQQEWQLAPTAKLIGDGSLRSSLESYAASHGLTRVEFRGFARDVARAIAPIDILIVPSLAEGFGLVVLEGMAARKVIIAADLPAVRELIQDRINGYLFPVGDSRVLAERLRDLLIHPQTIPQIVSQLDRWWVERGTAYDISTVVDQYQALLLA